MVEMGWEGGGSGGGEEEKKRRRRRKRRGGLKGFFFMEGVVGDLRGCKGSGGKGRNGEPHPLFSASALLSPSLILHHFLLHINALEQLSHIHLTDMFNYKKRSVICQVLYHRTASPVRSEHRVHLPPCLAPSACL